jgi:diguanylate cyclase (GGDEF)-like protein/PAS domain S-box-containing protein
MEDYSVVKAWVDENLSEDDTLLEYYKAHSEIFVDLDSKVKIIDLNEASLWLFGAKNKEELEGKLHTLIDPSCIEEIFKIFDAFRSGETTLERELEYVRLDGKRIYTITKLSILPGYEQSWGRVLFTNMDITERKMAEERLTYISLHDIMTGIYNRAFFEEEMARLSKSRISPISILVMDMDNLKAINDQYGHSAGDIALQTVANIVRDCFRSEDVVARIGGDEIAVLLQGLDEEGAQKGKERILQGIRDHNQLNNDLSMALSLSVGCATTSQGNKDLNSVFKIADTLMYEEKRQKNRRKPRSK